MPKKCGNYACEEAFHCHAAVIARMKLVFNNVFDDSAASSIIEADFGRLCIVGKLAVLFHAMHNVRVAFQKDGALFSCRRGRKGFTG